MTYTEYMEKAAPVSPYQRAQLDICHDAKSGWYRAVGVWNGAQINTAARTYPALQQGIREKYGLCIPARKALIFCHAWKGRRHALLQGFLPGSAVVDVSGYCVK